MNSAETKNGLRVLLGACCLVSGCMARLPVPQVARPTAVPVASRSAATAPRPTLPATGGNAFISKTRLQPPREASVELAGTILVDAAYFVASGGGRLVVTDGTTAVFPSETVLGADGASVVAGGAGNIVANDGATIVANDGATIVANDGATVVAGGAGNYRLSAAADLTAGAQLPAAAMLVRVISLEDNRPVPLGVDGEGKLVYVVLTDAKGRYTLHLPAALEGKIRLIASVPGSRDARLSYSYLPDVGGGAGESLDELQALSASYVRTVLVGKMAKAIVGLDVGAQSATDAANAHTQFDALTRPLFKQLFDTAKAANFDGLSPERRARTIQRFVDFAIAFTDLDTVVFTGNEEYTPPIKDELALAVLQEILGEITVKAEAAAAAHDDLNQRPYVLAANAARRAAGKPLVCLGKPADLGLFILQEYLGSIERSQTELAKGVFKDLGLPEERYHRLFAVYSNFVVAIGQGLFAQMDPPADGGVDPATKALQTIIREEGSEHPPAIPGFDLACPGAP